MPQKIKRETCSNNNFQQQIFQNKKFFQIIFKKFKKEFSKKVSKKISKNSSKNSSKNFQKILQKILQRILQKLQINLQKSFQNKEFSKKNFLRSIAGNNRRLWFTQLPLISQRNFTYRRKAKKCRNRIKFRKMKNPQNSYLFHILYKKHHRHKHF